MYKKEPCCGPGYTFVHTVLLGENGSSTPPTYYELLDNGGIELLDNGSFELTDNG